MRGRTSRGAGVPRTRAQDHTRGPDMHTAARWTHHHLRAQLLRGAGIPLHLGPAARGLFRRGQHSGREARGQGTLHDCGVHYGNGYDGGEPARRAAWDAPGRGGELEGDLRLLHLLERADHLLHFQVDTSASGTSRQGREGSVCLPRQAGTLAHPCRNYGRERRHFLLLQLCEPYDDRGRRLPCFCDDPDYGALRRGNVHRQPARGTALGQIYPCQGDSGHPGADVQRAGGTVLRGRGKGDCGGDDRTLLRRALRRVFASAASHHQTRSRRGDDGRGYDSDCLQPGECHRGVLRRAAY